MKSRDPHAQLHAAQLVLVERTLVGWLEQLLGRVPSDDEVLSAGYHVAFAPTELATYRHQGVSFCRYYVFRHEHAMALGLNAGGLHYAEIPITDWPIALKFYVENRKKRVSQI